MTPADKIERISRSLPKHGFVRGATGWMDCEKLRVAISESDNTVSVICFTSETRRGVSWCVDMTLDAPLDVIMATIKASLNTAF